MATGVACPSPFIQSFNNAGAFNVGGSILTQVGGINTATYQDVGLTTPLPNPIPINSRGEVSNAAGLSQQLFLTPNIIYVFTYFDKNGNQIDQANYVNGIQVVQTQASIGALLFPQTTAEIAAGVTPSFFYYLPGDIRRYGAILDGVTDDTAAVQRWLSVAGSLTFPVAQTALITTGCTLSSNTSISAVKGATISTAVGAFALFKATSKTNIIIDGLAFKNTHIGVAFAVTVAHAQFFSCTRPIVRNCEFIGMQCGGIEFDGCTGPVADNNYLHDGLYLSGQQQTTDIAVYGFTATTSGAVITNNRCYGGASVGVSVQDEYSGFNPSQNIISGNRIGNCLLYGILCYKPSFAAFNSYDQFINNYVENVQGVPALLAGQGGAGIYVVGAASGGTMVSGNSVVNCCVQTTTASQATGGISISGTNGAIFFTASVGGATSGTLSTGGSPFANANWNGATSSTWAVTFSNGEQRLVTLTNGATTCTWTGALAAGAITTAVLAPYYNDPLTVTGNKVSAMTQYDGILVTSSLGAGIVFGDNTVNMPANNTTGMALHIRNCSNLSIVGGVLVNQGTGDTVFIENQTNVNNITLKGIHISGGGNAASIGCLRIVGDGTHGIFGLTLSGLQVAPATGGAGAAAIYITTAAVSGGQISDCYSNVATMPALLIAACPGIRVSNCTLASTGAGTVTITGNCNGSFFDKSNAVSGGVISNAAGSGFHIDQFGAAAPVTGTYAVGDTIYNNFTATNVNSMFMCTVAGTPGTWVGHV